MSYLEDYKNYLICERRLRENTVITYIYFVGRLIKFLGKDARSTEIKDIRDFLKLRNLKSSNGNIANQISAFRSFYNWLQYMYRSEQLNELTFFLNKIIKTRQDKTIPEVPTSDEIARLRLTMEAYKNAASFSPESLQYQMVLRDYTILELFLATGARSVELRNIQFKDVDLEGKQVFIRKGKGGKQRVSIFGDESAQLLKEYLGLRDLKPEDMIFKIKPGKVLNNIVRKWAGKAGINQKIHSHSLRHFHITGAYEGDVPDYFISDQVGHEDPATTRRYTHLSVDHRRKMYKKCNF